MLHIHALVNGALVALDGATIAPDATVLWCDLFDPTPEEEAWVEDHLGVDIPTRAEMYEIELSSRLYQENDAVYLTASIVSKTDTPQPEIHSITFVLKGQCLVTVRYADPYSFRVFTKKLASETPSNINGGSILIGLMETCIARLADITENIIHGLDESNHLIFRPAIIEVVERQKRMPDFETILRTIGIQADLLSKSSESLLSLKRLLNFLQHRNCLEEGGDLNARTQTLLNDITALNEQTAFISSKVNFLLDATLGMIGIRQTAIIKIFSVAAVVFLPPTLVASIYGMNFNVMPELGWKLGYPLAIILMMLSAWLPYRFFKKKKWL